MTRANIEYEYRMWSELRWTEAYWRPPSAYHVINKVSNDFGVCFSIQSHEEGTVSHVNHVRIVTTLLWLRTRICKLYHNNRTSEIAAEMNVIRVNRSNNTKNLSIHVIYLALRALYIKFQLSSYAKKIKIEYNKKHIEYKVFQLTLTYI